MTSYCAACHRSIGREDRVGRDGEVYHRQCAPDDYPPTVTAVVEPEGDDAIKCTACGAVVSRETLSFSIESSGRVVGGDLIDGTGEKHEWRHYEEFGDLCAECAAPVIDTLNEVLDNDPTRTPMSDD
jgi:hypothetical protein